MVCNPPFYKSSEQKQYNQLESLSLARHEMALNLLDLFQAVTRLLTNGGAFYMIHRVERLDEIIILLNQHQFSVKRLRFVYTKVNKDAKMLLIEARHQGAMGSLKIDEPLYIYDEFLSYTKEVLKIFHLGDKRYDSTTSL